MLFYYENLEQEKGTGNPSVLHEPDVLLHCHPNPYFHQPVLHARVLLVLFFDAGLGIGFAVPCDGRIRMEPIPG